MTGTVATPRGSSKLGEQKWVINNPPAVGLNAVG